MSNLGEGHPQGNREIDSGSELGVPKKKEAWPNDHAFTSFSALLVILVEVSARYAHENGSSGIVSHPALPGDHRGNSQPDKLKNK